jgi:hypothetical protein
MLAEEEKEEEELKENILERAWRKKSMEKRKELFNRFNIMGTQMTLDKSLIVGTRSMKTCGFNAPSKCGNKKPSSK